MRPLFRRAVAILCVLACSSHLAISFGPWQGAACTEDRNSDGRPDVWRFYDCRGRLVRVAIDHNFDGRSDEQDYYVNGALTRRELDRNFDDRADLIEDFNATSHEHERSVLDVDFDGTLDLLVLVQDGRSVLTKWRQDGSTAAAPVLNAGQRTAADRLFAAADPFRADTSLRSLAVSTDGQGAIGFLSPTALSVGGASAMLLARVQSELHARDAASHSSLPVSPRPTRGPPVLPLA